MYKNIYFGIGIWVCQHRHEKCRQHLPMLELQLYPNGVVLTGVTVLYANFFHLQAAMSKTAHSLNESLTTFANNKSFNKLKNAIKYIMLSSTQLKKNLLPNIYQNHQSTLHLLKRSLVTGGKILTRGYSCNISHWTMADVHVHMFHVCDDRLMPMSNRCTCMIFQSGLHRTVESVLNCVEVHRNFI